MDKKPNILYIMCDQFRYDAIAALGNDIVKTPNIDRLVNRGVSFTNAYSTCPVCVPARYTVRTGREPHTTGVFENQPMLDGDMQKRCGNYLATEMSKMGYNTFGIGKFHTEPEYEDLGFDIQMNTEELWTTQESRKKDSYSNFICENHPEYAHVEQLHGERTEMYYMPQTSLFPAELTVESFITNCALEQIDKTKNSDKPFFGFVSFVGPHPPCAPPIPYNRMYNPDDMINPDRGNIENDYIDEHLPYMNHLIWADELNDFSARMIRSRYYGEISYIDTCIGKLLDKIESLLDSDNTLICFFADHGDFLGDHNAWQKESYYEQSTRVPFLVSWPNKLQKSRINKELVCLTDLFGIATQAANRAQVRDGINVLKMLQGEKGRTSLFATYGNPGTPAFKFMIRKDNWKYIWMSNGGRKQLFDLDSDSREMNNLADDRKDVSCEMHGIALLEITRPTLMLAVENGDYKGFPFVKREYVRINQMAREMGIDDFGQIDINNKFQ